MAADENLSGEDIQRLLDEKMGKASSPSPPSATKTDNPPARPTDGRSTKSVQDDIEQLINSAESGVKQAASGKPDAGKAVPFELNNLQRDPSRTDSLGSTPLDLLSDVELDLRIELGRTHMRLEEVLQLRSGAVVALDKLAGDPVDVFINDRMVARGEILVMNENFCVRVTELLSG